MFKLILLLVAILFVVPNQFFGANFVSTGTTNVVAPPLEEGMVLPEFQRKTHSEGAPIIKVLREMILEAIKQKNIFGASVMLIARFTPALQGAIFSWEAQLRALPKDKSIKPDPKYYFNCARILDEKVMKKSDKLMVGVNREKAKAQLNINELSARVNRFFDNLKAAVENSPSGAYLDWENVTFDGVKATDEWVRIYNDLRVLGWDQLTNTLGSGLISNMKYHGEERKSEIDPSYRKAGSGWFGGK